MSPSKKTSVSAKIEPMLKNMNGADVVVQSLVNAGVTVMFAYPGGFSMPLHQALTRFRDKIRCILPRQEQGGGFAAQGYARATGKLGVCMTTSGPGATNIVTPIADAKMDGVPLLIITGQVPVSAIGSDAFQETPMVEVCRGITKHHYLVTNVNDLARIMQEAIFVATSGRPGPVLVDIPKDVQTTPVVPVFDQPMQLPGYNGELPKAKLADVEKVAEAIQNAKKPIILAGGGIIAADASKELFKLVEKTGIPITTTFTALSAFPREHRLSLGMLGMHGNAFTNHAVHDCDLFLALGTRFSDRVTGKVSEFIKHAKVIHVDADPSEINKVKAANIPIISDVKYFLTELNKIVTPPKADLAPWIGKIDEWIAKMPLKYNEKSPYILPQAAIRELWRATKDKDVIICTGVGQHQMWTAQFYGFSKPRTFLSSGGLGTMGFGLPAAMGAKVACPEKIVVDIDGDGSFQMNIQEMGTCVCEKIPVKVMLLNNQHLGMVMQWEDRFHASNRAHTYLGPYDKPEAFGKGEGDFPSVRYPDFITIAKGYGWDALNVSKKEDLPAAIATMLKSEKPFLLDVQVPYHEHVLPFTPPGATVFDMIRE
ncbi:MAG: biosynthetic-type acetolactate synthase large subunit [Planctomycetaceae bacterium]|nr:biosynthetic-type acetolactate synthase large subunit [Planctomycetaceae bacterium]